MSHYIGDDCPGGHRDQVEKMEATIREQAADLAAAREALARVRRALTETTCLLSYAANGDGALDVPRAHAAIRAARALLDAEPRPIATLGTPGPFPPGAMKPEWEGDPAHIQTVSATTKQIDAFNMNPGKEWVIYFTEPTTGACAQTFARLDNYLVRAEPRPTEEPAPAPRCRVPDHRCAVCRSRHRLRCQGAAVTDLREALRALADEAERTALAIEDDGAEPGWKLPHLRREILRARRALLAADESRDMQVGMQVDKPESAETPRVDGKERTP